MPPAANPCSITSLQAEAAPWRSRTPTVRGCASSARWREKEMAQLGRGRDEPAFSCNE